MTKPDRDPGRGQLHRRSARAWRDEANPTGPGQAKDESAPDEGAAPDEAAVGRDQVEASEDRVEEPGATAGPGGGGATEWSGRTKHHEGLHSGPSRKE